MESVAKAKCEGKVLDLTSIFRKIIEGPPGNLLSLKYGQAMESEAIYTLIETFKDEHRKARVPDCGIFICKDRPFIGGRFT